MFTKRFITVFLSLVLALGLGINVLAQNEDSGGSRADNPVLKWLSWLRNQAELVQQNDTQLHFFEPLEELAGEVAQKLPLERLNPNLNLNRENHGAAPDALRALVSKWADALQGSNANNVSAPAWLKQAMKGFSNLFNKLQLPNSSLTH